MSRWRTGDDPGRDEQSEADDGEDDGGEEQAEGESELRCLEFGPVDRLSAAREVGREEGPADTQTGDVLSADGARAE